MKPISKLLPLAIIAACAAVVPAMGATRKPPPAPAKPGLNLLRPASASGSIGGPKSPAAAAGGVPGVFGRAKAANSGGGSAPAPAPAGAAAPAPAAPSAASASGSAQGAAAPAPAPSAAPQ